MMWMGGAALCVPAAKGVAPYIAPYVNRGDDDCPELSEHEMDMMAVDHKIQHMLEEGLLDHDFEPIPEHDVARREESKRRYALAKAACAELDAANPGFRASRQETAEQAGMSAEDVVRMFKERSATTDKARRAATLGAPAAAAPVAQ